MSFSDHLRQAGPADLGCPTDPSVRRGVGQRDIAGTQIQVLHPARRQVSRRPRPCVFCRSAESAGFRIGPAFDQTRRRDHRRRTQPPRRIRVTLEDDREADVVRADGADELRLHRHMLTVAHTGSAAEITVVALPCAWIYCVVGQHLLKHGPPKKNHPYRDWLMLYASPEFAEVQRWMRKKVDQWAKTAGKEEKRRMEESFVISSRYEWMFWEMAWNEEEWPV